MNINGKQVVKGTGTIKLDLVEDSTSGGEGGVNKKWAISFPNGLRIQSDTVSVTANNSLSEHSLPVAYTEAHYVVLVSCATEVGTGVDQHCNHGEPSATDNLGKVTLENIGEAAREFTYLSIGKDSV